MTIILFLVDTSASMNQRSFLGTTILDVTKNAIETFQKIRSKNPNSKWDRLMLLTYDEPPGNIKAGWKETHLQFATQLKNLTAQGVTEIGPALKNAFDMLNMNRNQSGIDTYGQGRCPFYIEPAIIISFSDGQSMVTANGIQKTLTLPMANGLVGSELTKEPFRWDQRVFGIVLKIPAVEIPEPQNETTFIPTADTSPIDSMCEVTGGRSYLVSTPRQLAQTLESLALKAAMHGVVVNFENIESPLSITDNNDDSRPNTPNVVNAWKSTKKMIFVKSSAQRGHSVGHWPLPEGYWPDAKAKTLPARDAQPYVKFQTPKSPPAAHLMQILPMDVYELEPSPLTQYILKNKSNQCYQCLISQSAKYTDTPFGFLQAHASSQKVFLHVMPYNYPVLLNLLDDLQKVSMKPTPKWKVEFDNYLRAMPGYYASYLRRALSRIGVHNVVPESLDSCLSFMVVSHLKQVRTKAKQEYETLVSSVGQCTPPTEFISVVNKNAASLLARQDFNELLQYTAGDYSSIASLQKELVKYESFPIAVPRSNAATLKTFNYKNPYDIARKDLLSQISKLRATLLRPHGVAGSLLKEEHLHSVPVARMGNYHEYLAKVPQPLRKIDTQPERVHTFGNPFKVNKNLMIDEADEAMPGLAGPGSSSPKRNKRESSSSVENHPSSPAKKKRKPGPLPKHISLTNRPSTPPLPPPSPTPSDTQSNGDEPELISIANNKKSVQSLLQTKSEVNGVMKQNGISDSTPSSSPTSSSDNMNSPTQFTAKVIQQQRKSQQSTTPSPTNGIDLYNDNVLKLHLLRQVRRPGKNYTELFRHLGTLRGVGEQVLVVLDRVIYEAYRFKRVSLTDQLLRYKQSVNNQSDQSTKEHNGLTAAAHDDKSTADDDDSSPKTANKQIPNAISKSATKVEPKQNTVKAPTLSREKSKPHKL